MADNQQQASAPDAIAERIKRVLETMPGFETSREQVRERAGMSQAELLQGFLRDALMHAPNAIGPRGMGSGALVTPRSVQQAPMGPPSVTGGANRDLQLYNPGSAHDLITSHPMALLPPWATNRRGYGRMPLGPAPEAANQNARLLLMRGLDGAP